MGDKTGCWATEPESGIGAIKATLEDMGDYEIADIALTALHFDRQQMGAWNDPFD